jgi:hypothetical protein
VPNLSNSASWRGSKRQSKGSPRWASLRANKVLRNVKPSGHEKAAVTSKQRKIHLRRGYGTKLTRLLQTNAPGTTHQQECRKAPEVDCDVNKDPWKAAAEKLDDESKAGIASGKSLTQDDKIVDAVELSLRRIAQQREKHGENSWKYEEKDKTMQMLQSVMIFKGLVYAGLKFDPTGYGEQA